MADQPHNKERATENSSGLKTLVRYYLDGIPNKAKLLELDVSEKIFLGRLRDLVDSSKRVLKDVSNEDILMILDFGDWHISRLIENGIKAKAQDGSLVALTSGLLDRIVRTDLLRLTVKFLSDNEFRIARSPESDDPPLLISPIRFCAASALADADRAMDYSRLEGHWSDIAGFHALQVAETVAMMKTLNRDDPLNPPSIEREILLQRAREGATARLANDRDGKQAAKRKVHALWKEWKEGKRPRILTVEQFAMEALRQHPELKSSSTIRNWSVKWTRELKLEKLQSS